MACWLTTAHQTVQDASTSVPTLRYVVAPYGEPLCRHALSVLTCLSSHLGLELHFRFAGVPTWSWGSQCTYFYTASSKDRCLEPSQLARQQQGRTHCATIPLLKCVAYNADIPWAYICGIQRPLGRGGSSTFSSKARYPAAATTKALRRAAHCPELVL